MNKQFAKSCTPYYIIKPKLLRVVSKALKPGDLALAHFCHLPRIFLQSRWAFHGSRNAPNFKAFANALPSTCSALPAHRPRSGAFWLSTPAGFRSLPWQDDSLTLTPYLASLAPELQPQPSPRHSIDR